MLVTILPYFLAAQVAVDDTSRQSEWAMYGGECTYDVFVMMSLSNITRADDNFCSSIKSELKCRPKGQDSLSCHFQNSRIRHPGPEEGNCTNSMGSVPTRTRFIDEEPFEIRFDPRGIQNLVVHRTIPRWQLDMIKVIVSQLNIGFEVLERRDRFAIMENSTMGYCEVDVKFVHDSSEENDDDEHEDGSVEQGEKEGEDFEIQFMSTNNKPARTLDEKFHVQKIREPTRCPRRTIYFFGNEGDYSRGNGELYMDMTDSTSHIMITKNKFKSLTMSAGVMKMANKSHVMRPHQNIVLKLKRIDLARNSPPEIQNPASTSLFAFSSLETIPEDA
ncbi:PREDICTED: vitellogenin-3-like [Dinoponera quadriceps]|uniref:Vitellogenin-3-like n=1 Tax=Dinoponera quadriceps TaxID=609295 RepID=A0A6P3WZP8_DINQU|nr:PREDICTED: vitellogenin-3-like [Dinoponera quadriceps]